MTCETLLHSTLDNIPGTNISFCALSFVGICDPSEKVALNADMTIAIGGMQEQSLGTQTDPDVLHLKNQ
jgi:hypothetical protein